MLSFAEYSIRLSTVLNIGIMLSLVSSLVYDLLIYMSIQLIVFEIFKNNPDGGIFLHSFKISVSILVEYNRCSDIHNCYLIVFVALFMLLNVSSLITHMLPFNLCLISCFFPSQCLKPEGGRISLHTL